ncbi:PLU-1-like protein domain-containing protein [Phthorimaea operculella]|nr:PLU-1-like protein domain-containing protein [Phthorimaea operculella]
MRTRTRHHDPKYRLTIHELTLFAQEIDGLACVLPEGKYNTFDLEKCLSVIQQLDLNKMRTRTRHHDPKYRLTIHELTLFAQEIDGLACVLPEVIQQLDLNKMRTRTRHHDPKYRLTIHELTLFAQEIDGLACVLPEGSAVKEVLRQTSEFESRAAELLRTELDQTEPAILRELDEVVELGSRLCIVLPQLAPLQARQQQVRFLEEVRTHREDCSTLTPEVIDRLLNDAENITPHRHIETQRAKLGALKVQVEEWENRAKAVLIDTTKTRDPRDDYNPQYTTLAELDALLAEGEEIDAALPSYHTLQTAVSHARDWLAKYTTLAELDALLAEGEEIDAALPSYHTLQTAVSHARGWLAKYTTLAELDALLAEGEEIDAALPSYHTLQTAVSHARDWLAKVSTFYTTQYTTLAELDALLAEGEEIDAALPSYHTLQTAVSHARDWLAKYTTLAELDALLAEGEEIDAALPSYHTLQTAVSHARDWLAKVEEMQSKDLYPYMHSVEALVKRGQQIPLALFEKDQLATALLSAKEWKRGAADMFLKKNWPYSLLEALSPRTECGTARRRMRGNATSDPPPSSLEAGMFLKNFSEDSTPTEIVAAFKQAETRELAALKELRARNMRKEVRAPAASGATFCVCQKRQYGVMTQCELCKDWFHASCIAAAKEDREESPERVETPFPTPDPKFLCPDCTRTKRPRLDRILALLVWLQKLPVRLSRRRSVAVRDRASHGVARRGARHAGQPAHGHPTTAQL